MNKKEVIDITITVDLAEKQEAEKIISHWGWSLSEAVNILLAEIVSHKCSPLEVPESYDKPDSEAYKQWQIRNELIYEEFINSIEKPKKNRNKKL